VILQSNEVGSSYDKQEVMKSVYSILLGKLKGKGQGFPEFS
jgi:hypothetical protein